MSIDVKNIRLDSVDSTNNYLKREKHLLDVNYLSVRADVQTAGRGRSSRQWVSVPGKDLTFSVVINSGADLKNIPVATLYAGLSVYRVLEKYTGNSRLKIKWPNDIYFSGKKICGILCEAVRNNESSSLIIGIGINVNSEHLNGRSGVISLFDATSALTDLDVLQEEIITSLKGLFDKFQSPADEEILDEWRRNNCSIGEEVIYMLDNRQADGTVRGINPDCSLSIMDSKQNILTDCFDNIVFCAFDKGITDSN